MTEIVIHLLRHGAPQVAGLLLGRTDTPSTPAGIAACVRQAEGLTFDSVVTSDLQRAARAGAAIAQARGMTQSFDPRWRELDFGAWDGLAPSQVNSEQMAAFWQDPDANPPPEGERWSALLARVSAAFADIATRDTLVVTHGGAIRAALAGLFGFEQRHLWAFDLPYAAVVSLKVWPGTPLTAQITGLRA